MAKPLAHCTKTTCEQIGSSVGRISAAQSAARPNRKLGGVCCALLPYVGSSEPVGTQTALGSCRHPPPVAGIELHHTCRRWPTGWRGTSGLPIPIWGHLRTGWCRDHVPRCAAIGAEHHTECRPSPRVGGCTAVLVEGRWPFWGRRLTLRECQLRINGGRHEPDGGFGWVPAIGSSGEGSAA